MRWTRREKGNCLEAYYKVTAENYKNQKNKKTYAHSLLMAYTNDLSW